MVRYSLFVLMVGIGGANAAIPRTSVISGHAIPKYDCSVNTEDLVVEAVGPLPKQNSACQSAVQESGLFALSCSLPSGQYRVQLKNIRTGFVESTLLHIHGKHAADVSFDPCPEE